MNVTLPTLNLKETWVRDIIPFVYDLEVSALLLNKVKISTHQQTIGLINVGIFLYTHRYVYIIHTMEYYSITQQ